MGTPGGVGRRRITSKLLSAEDQALDIIAKEAESRLAARRAARAEAREIRMRELEKQQKELDDHSDRYYDHGEPGYNMRQGSHIPVTRSGSQAGSSSYAGSRRSSEDSIELDRSDMKLHLRDTEDRFRKAMVTNAQLDNEKSALTYQVDMYKDELEEIEENFIQLQRENREKYRDLELLKKDYEKLKQENNFLQCQMKLRDLLIQEHGLVLVGSDESGAVEVQEAMSEASNLTLLTQQSIQLLEGAGEGTLDVRLRRLAEEKQELVDQIRRLQLDLDEEKHKNLQYEKMSTGPAQHMNGPDLKLMEVQREATKLVSDYKFKLQKSEQEIATLQGSVARLDGQVSRFRSTSEMAEKIEDELKLERRKLQRELREALSRIEELESSNSHLEKRIEKLKSTRNNLLK